MHALIDGNNHEDTNDNAPRGVLGTRAYSRRTWQIRGYELVQRFARYGEHSHVFFFFGHAPYQPGNKRDRQFVRHNPVQLTMADVTMLFMLNAVLALSAIFNCWSGLDGVPAT